ncbi:MAG: histidine kinase [Ignavibacteriae bacterium]|nr:histidine kinase [Ignavibacteriota bacterium]MCI0707913.1 histidine kinase [Ignavibacteriota bacterium]
MHPILSDKRKLAIYLLAWLIIGILLATLLVAVGDVNWIPAFILTLPMALVYAFICLSSWYLCRAFPLAKTDFLKLSLIYLISGSLESSLWVLLGQGWLWLFQHASPHPALDNVIIDSRLFFGIGLVLYLLVVAILYLIVALEETRKIEERSFQLRLLAQEAELRALRAQIDPHFLFNSLNSISALTTKSPEAARNMTVLLADFFRKSLKLGAQESISLSQEIELALGFLQIEQVRFGERLKVEQHIDESALPCLVPPLILQPIVENAVNHGIKHLIEGGTIRLHTELNGSRLSIVVENPCDPDRSRTTSSGLGLANIRNRLQTSFQKDARLDVSEHNGMFRAELALPANE